MNVVMKDVMRRTSGPLAILVCQNNLFHASHVQLYNSIAICSEAQLDHDRAIYGAPSFSTCIVIIIHTETVLHNYELKVAYIANSS